jgi:CheY-like chemotaxis protein
MPRGGTLEIGIEPFYARDSFVRAHPGLHEGPFVRLWVRDTGHGMDAETRARAFEPFFTTKPPGSGSGLGLSMIHGILRDHRGAAWIESTVGQGTTVSCVFPASEAEPVGELPGEAPLPRGRGERVLYVDDETSLAALGERRLQGLGYRVTVFTDPERAVAAVRAAPAELDLVITDYSMPRMSGLELARVVTGLRADLPVIILTGYVEDLPPADVVAAGVRLFVTKPVTIRGLAESVRKVLDATP